MMPNEWKESTILDLCVKDKYPIVDGPFGSNLKTIHYRTSGVPIIQSRYVTSGKFRADEYIYVDEEKFRQEIRSKVSPNDIVMAKIGENCGRSAIVPPDHPVGILSGNSLKITIDNSKANTIYIWNLLEYIYSKNRFTEIKTIGGQPAISMANLKSFKVKVPPLNEQEKIANILSTWDQAIDRIEKINFQFYKKRSHYISKLLCPNQKGWKQLRVLDLGELSKGKGISKSEVIDSGFPCIRYGEIYTSHHTFIRKFYSYISKHSADNSKQLNKGDIVFAGSGETAEEIGKSVAHLGNEVAYVGGDTIVLSPVGHSSLFLSYLFNSPYTRKQLNVLGQGNAVVHLYPKSLADVSIFIPDIKTQIRIESFLKSIDDEILIYSQIIQSLKNQKQGLIQQLLTGKKRVKT